MPPTICRTCLTVLKENSHAFFALENKIPGLTFREKLNYCIPELALDILPNAVICTNCSMTLNLAYEFKTKCLEVETKVRTYLQDSSELNQFIQSSQAQWLSSSYSETSKKSHDVPASNPVYVKSEPDDYYEDSLEEINFEHKPFQVRQFECNDASIDKIKIENNINEVSEPSETTNTQSFNYDMSQNPSKFYFAKALQRLKDKNYNNSFAYQQVFEQLNLIKAIKTLTNKGTEIMNYSGSSMRNQRNNDNPTTDLQKQKPIFERYDCYYCSRTFDRLSLLKTHTISHTGVKPFTCNVCGKGCSHKGELNNHIRTHTGEKPFKCTLCEASFSQISNMKIHMRTHTGEKPYKCDYCQKTFSHKCGVKVHMRTHTGERPYKCEICLKTYTHKKDLDDHMRTHTGEKYKCTICSKEITYKKNLSAHMITHSGKHGVMNKKNNSIKYSERLTY